MDKNLNSPLLQSFVCPELCLALATEGLKVCSPFRWLFANGTYSIHSFCFDHDEYYRQAMANVDFVRQHITECAAFQMIDMELLLPNYLLSNTNGEYELMCEILFGMEPQRGNRLPDVFAAMVLKGLQTYKIKAINAVAFLHNKILETTL
jgi:hypothetical protein